MRFFSLLRRLYRKGRRSIRACRCCAKRILGLPLRIYIENHWRLGDEVLAIPFYHLVRAKYPAADIAVGVNYPSLLAKNPDVRAADGVGEFDCDLFIFAREDARHVPRLRHLCQRHAIPYRPIEPMVAGGDDGKLPENMPSGTVVGYSCGAGWGCKSWIPASFRAVAGELVSEPRPVRFVELGRGCVKTGVGEDMTDALEIHETAAVLRRCSLYIGPDSGLVHLALAVGTRAVGLYGPVLPELAFGPRAGLTAVRSPAACAGCYTLGRMQRPGVCPLGMVGADGESFACMRAITPKLVCSAVRDLLSQAES